MLLFKIFKNCVAKYQMCMSFLAPKVSIIAAATLVSTSHTLPATCVVDMGGRAFIVAVILSNTLVPSLFLLLALNMF